MSAPADATMEEIRTLVAFDTTSRDSNLELVEHVERHLESLGIASTRIPNPEGTKANLLATIPAADGSTSGGIVLSAHTDVVPVDGQQWSSEPFAPEVRDGRLYARGSADMKSFLGVVLVKAADMVAQPLAEPIHLALSYDEEIGCVGAIDLVDRLASQGGLPRGCVVGEPTSMRVVRGHKSMNVFRIDVRGVAAHSSLTPQGENAVAAAAELVRFVQGVGDEMREQGPFDDGYVVPYTSVSVNRIDGGIAINTIPAECTIHFEFRALPTVDHAALVERFRAECARVEADMRSRFAEASVTLTTTAAAPGVDTAADAEIVGLAAAWGATPSDEKVTYGTEAGLFANAGIPTIVCGPGDIAQAHAPDEFIHLEQIAACEAFVDALVADLRA
ncbi:acetylornithine deacetylase [Agrococcus jejuensis]|uniref:acetylornithine deacetylase n=1 Tax=Agrococcus jejuensis TaxID=399736 RepID=UPI0021B55D6E|nr:acetylornithine deacetylase [Agrococcus jejuensis]